MTTLIERLPPYDHYRQNWHPSVTNWLPFRWQGFEQTTGYTYVLNDLSDERRVWRGLRENIRREIRKSAERHAIQVDSNGSLDEFLVLSRLTFSRQGLKWPFSEDYVRRVDAACVSHGCRRILVARGGDGRPHAGAYIVWSEESAYYLMGGGDPALRGSGATSMCLWEAIRFAATVSRRFDFEGSMIEPIERYFRAFGAEQVPYLKVSRTPSRLLRGLLAFKS